MIVKFHAKARRREEEAKKIVTPAKAGVHGEAPPLYGFPAFAGMTGFFDGLRVFA
jgi:hypothetical protein